MSSPNLTVFIPGSYDPIHLGHLDVVLSAADLFGRVVIGVLYNRNKTAGLFTPDERAELIAAAVTDDDRIQVMTSSDLAVQAAAEVGADFIVKGLRTAGDFEIEQQMAQTNESVSGVRTVFVPCRPAHAYISSRFVREIASRGGDVAHMVGAPVAAALSDKFAAPTN